MRAPYLLTFLLIVCLSAHAKKRPPTPTCPLFTYCPDACNKKLDQNRCVQCFCDDSSEDDSEETTTTKATTTTTTTTTSTTTTTPTTTTQESLEVSEERLPACHGETPCESECTFRKVGQEKCTRCICPATEPPTSPIISTIATENTRSTTTTTAAGLPASAEESGEDLPPCPEEDTCKKPCKWRKIGNDKCTRCICPADDQETPPTQTTTSSTTVTTPTTTVGAPASVEESAENLPPCIDENYCRVPCKWRRIGHDNCTRCICPATEPETSPTPTTTSTTTSTTTTTAGHTSTDKKSHCPIEEPCKKPCTLKTVGNDKCPRCICPTSTQTSPTTTSTSTTTTTPTTTIGGPAEAGDSSEEALAHCPGEEPCKKPCSWRRVGRESCTKCICPETELDSPIRSSTTASTTKTIVTTSGDLPPCPGEKLCSSPCTLRKIGNDKCRRCICSSTQAETPSTTTTSTKATSTPTTTTTRRSTSTSTSTSTTSTTSSSSTTVTSTKDWSTTEEPASGEENSTIQSTVTSSSLSLSSTSSTSTASSTSTTTKTSTAAAASEDISEEKLQVCPDQEPCANGCTFKRIDRDNCTKCACDHAFEIRDLNLNCIEPIDCTNCTISVDTFGCKSCECPTKAPDAKNFPLPDPPAFESPDAECNSKKPCKGTNTRCTDGKCVCEDGYERNTTDNTCYRLPRLGDVCRVNGSIFRCYGSGVFAYCNTGVDRSNPDKDKCICEQFHQPNLTTNECVLRVKLVGDSCLVDTDCLTAHSYCNHGKCDCQDGFVATDKKCLPKEHKCPEGIIFNDDGSVRKCEYRFGSYDTCPSGTFCFVHARTLTVNGTSVGHCCVNKIETTQPVCPIGLPLANGFCPAPDEKISPGEVDKLAVGQLLPDKGDTCPATHECMTHPQLKGPSPCCPVPCSQGPKFFAHGGRCYKYSAIGDRCDIQAQCIGGSLCVENQEGYRQCQCPSRFTQILQSYCKPPSYDDIAPVLPIGDKKTNASKTPSASKKVAGSGILGQPCDRNSDCITAYAACSSKKVCTCSNGFVAQGSICEPHEYRCPAGAPLKGKDHGVLRCYFSSADGANGGGNHTCPPSYFCYRYPDTTTLTGYSVGHCCKETTQNQTSVHVVCPIGDPLLSGSCPLVARARSRKHRAVAAKADKLNPCPKASHVCYFYFQRPNDQPCCPKPCPQSPNHFAADGTCYEHVFTGQPCVVDAQCAGGHCRKALGGGKICE